LMQKGGGVPMGEEDHEESLEEAMFMPLVVFRRSAHLEPHWRRRTSDQEEVVMKSNLKNWCGVVAIVGIVLGLMAGLESQVWTKNCYAAGAIGPEAPVGGMNYSEWSARWWQWNVSLPVDTDPEDPDTNQNPLYDGADCKNGANGQFGPVWFLTASFTGAERTCDVPAGKFLFFPLVNTECSTLEPDPWHGDNEEELRSCATSFVLSAPFAIIDGVAVRNLERRYLVVSPMYTVALPPGNWWGVDPCTPDGGSAQSVSNGYWLMLAPLSPGEHTIQFGGTITNPDGSSGSYAASYILNIVK
jgi:hypothetical protein